MNSNHQVSGSSNLGIPMRLQFVVSKVVNSKVVNSHTPKANPLSHCQTHQLINNEIWANKLGSAKEIIDEATGKMIWAITGRARPLYPTPFASHPGWL